MVKYTWFIIFIFFAKCGTGTTSQQNIDTAISEIEVGGSCDGCDIMFEGMPAGEQIKDTTSLAEDSEPGEKMEIRGMVYQKDKKTPAANVILYVYHTNAAGYYQPASAQTHGRRNGHLRGWVKTNNNGQFKIRSTRPAPYPNRQIPAHIHVIVKEPGRKHYYIDEIRFADDPLNTQEERSKAEGRGGNLLITLDKAENTWLGNVTINLGENIPGY